MKPLNTEERKQSFTGFLLFFLITAALIVGAVFFGMQVPFKQNERLKAQVARQQQDQAFADRFSKKMNETSILLDSVNKNGTQATLVDGTISENIKAMNASLLSDSIANKQLYMNMVQSLNQLQLAKSGLRNSSGKDQDAVRLQQDLVDVRTQLFQCQQLQQQRAAMQSQAQNQQPH